MVVNLVNMKGNYGRLLKEKRFWRRSQSEGDGKPLEDLGRWKSKGTALMEEQKI